MYDAVFKDKDSGKKTTAQIKYPFLRCFPYFSAANPPF